MKKRLTVGVIVTAMAATMSFVVAGPYGDERADARALSPERIVAAVQSFGLIPTTRAVRRGHYYVLHALDRRGTELRVVADAAFGDIIDVVPIYTPRYDGGPRIIHVPQAAEHDEASVPDDADAERAPAPHRQVRPLHRRVIEHKAAPAPKSKLKPKPQRSVRSVPPPPARGLTPIYPTPRFKAKIEAPQPSPRDDADVARAPAPIDARKQTDLGPHEQPDTVDDRTDNDTGQFRAADERAERTQLPPPGYAPPIPPPLPQGHALPPRGAPPAAQDESDVGSNAAPSEDPRRQ